MSAIKPWEAPIYAYNEMVELVEYEPVEGVGTDLVLGAVAPAEIKLGSYRKATPKNILPAGDERRSLRSIAQGRAGLPR